MNTKIDLDLKYLKLLSHEYPTIQSACTEIINLEAIMNLPKGTEHFMSDLHGEDKAFLHILNNAAGIIKEKIDTAYQNRLSAAERKSLAALIYYPEQMIAEVESDGEDMDDWYRITLNRLIDVCRTVASKYTRSKVRKALPKDFEYIIDELLHTNYDDMNKEMYYANIIDTIININRAEEFIVALANLIKRMAVDRLHIVGDVFDRGSHADVILDRLMEHHSVDLQWGNHDVLWMGAACGSDVCIAIALKNSLRYNNLDIVENAYGINLLPLAMLATETYHNVELYAPKGTANMSNRDRELVAQMHKAIFIIQLKLEGQLVRRRPEFNMADRDMLSRINYADMTIEIDGETHRLMDTELPTVDPKDPTALSPAEAEVVRQLRSSFENSTRLVEHVRFLYGSGSLYRCMNGNLLYHGVMPADEDGNFRVLKLGGKNLSGKALFDFCDATARSAFYAKEGSPERLYGMDFMWFLWCGRWSPVFGRHHMATFERMFIEDESTWTEPKDPYYSHYESEAFCEKILAEFSLTGSFCKIVNGHIPVKVKEGESPMKAGGRLIVIDGGFCSAYQKYTGIAGYTMFFSSHGIRISAHQPWGGVPESVRRGADITSETVISENMPHRLLVGQTDTGTMLKERIGELEQLLTAYRLGVLSEGEK